MWWAFPWGAVVEEGRWRLSDTCPGICTITQWIYRTVNLGNVHWFRLVKNVLDFFLSCFLSSFSPSFPPFLSFLPSLLLSTPPSLHPSFSSSSFFFTFPLSPSILPSFPPSLFPYFLPPSFFPSLLLPSFLFFLSFCPLFLFPSHPLFHYFTVGKFMRHFLLSWSVQTLLIFVAEP